MGKRGLRLAALFLVMVAVAGCAAGLNPAVDTARADGDIAGFWLGLWHGLIAFFTFITSLFSDNVRMYEVHNNGGWYDFGFVLGAGILFGGGLFGRSRYSVWRWVFPGASMRKSRQPRDLD